MKHFIISLLLILHISLRAQTLPDRPYEKIIINDITPEWYFVNYDVDMDNDTFDGYNNFLSIESFDHLFYNNAIYEVFYRQNYIEPTGTYVQKRSLEDGTLLWRKYIGYPRDQQQIFGRNLLINDKDQLEVIFQVKCDPYDVFHPLLGRTNMALFQIEFDTANGNVINEIKYQCTDTLYVQSNFDLFYFNNASRFFAIQDTFYFTQSEWNGNQWERVLFKLGKDFRKEKVLMKKYPKKYNCYGDLPVFYNDSTKIVFNSNCITKRIEMTFVDNVLDSVKTIISDSLSDKLNELQVKYFDPVERRFLLENVINFDTKEIELIIIDDNGRLLKRIIMPEIYNRSYRLFEWNNIDEITFLAPGTKYTSENIPYVTLDVLKSNQQGFIDVVYSFTFSDSLRYIANSNLVGSDSDHYYLEFKESSLKITNTGYSIDRKASAVSMMKIRKELLLNPTSGTSQSVNYHLICNPNPTSDIVNITIPRGQSAKFVHLSDQTGRIVHSETLYGNTSQLNIAHLGTGIYFVFLTDHNGVRIGDMKKVVKI